MERMNHSDNVTPIKSIDEIGKDITQEQIKFIYLGNASHEFVVKFIENRIIEQISEKDENYLNSLSMESLISIVESIEKQKNVSLKSIYNLNNEQLETDDVAEKAA